MPVAKNSNGKVALTLVRECKEPCCSGKKTSHLCCDSHGFGKKILVTLIGILLVYLIVFVATLIRNNIEKYYFIGKADRPERTITVQAQGKVTVKPDVAVVTMGTISQAPTVEEAQKKNTEIMNNLVAKLKNLNIDEKDLQTTDYNIYPQYDYTPEKGQVLKGYQVNQSVTIKIRDLQNSSKVLALAGEVGANSVSGLSFTVDDREIYKTQARDLAMKQVAEKAKALQKALGVRMVNVVSYDEYEGGNPVPLYRAMSESVGMGGGDISPNIQSGSNEILLNVNVTFEIR